MGQASGEMSVGRLHATEAETFSFVALARGDDTRRSASDWGNDFQTTPAALRVEVADIDAFGEPTRAPRAQTAQREGPWESKISRGLLASWIQERLGVHKGRPSLSLHIDTNTYTHTSRSHIYICIILHVYKHKTNTHTVYIHRHVCTYVCTCMCRHVYTCMYAYICICTIRPSV